MMTENITIRVDLLSGMMAIKTQGIKNVGMERVNAYCLASIKMAGLMHVRRREKRVRKIVEVTDRAFCVW